MKVAPHRCFTISRTYCELPCVYVKDCINMITLTILCVFSQVRVNIHFVRKWKTIQDYQDVKKLPTNTVSYVITQPSNTHQYLLVLWSCSLPTHRCDWDRAASSQHQCTSVGPPSCGALVAQGHLAHPAGAASV